MVALCLVLVLSISTAASAGAESFYQNSKQGWFWYQNPPPERKKGKKKKPAPPRNLPSLDNYTVKELWNMYPDDFQKLLNVIQKKAVQKPTEHNILQYLTMQDIARRKALAYTNATMYVTQKYGQLFNVGQVYPSITPGVTARVRMQQAEITATIRRARDYALLFFVRSGCDFCAQQARILAYFQDRYGWPIKTVDIGRNINAALRFGITVTPTILLIRKGDDRYMTVATGVIALTELERKLYRAIRYLAGDRSQENYLMYDFQKGSPLDPGAILKMDKPWAVRN